MYNPNDPHAAFQHLAAQAMLATGSAQGPTNRYSDASEAPSIATRYGDDADQAYNSNGATTRRKQQQPWSPTARGQQPPSQFSRSSIAGIAKPQPGVVDGGAVQRPSGAVPPPGAPGAPPRFSTFPLPPRPARGSAQSRRSEQAYANRRSVVAGGRRSVATTARVSAAGTLSTDLWSGEDEVDDLDWDRPRPPTTRADIVWRLFWVLVPIIISLVLIAVGVVYLVFGNDTMVSNLQIWRLCFFIAGLPVIWWIGAGVTRASVWVVENSKLFKMQNVLYYAYAVRGPLANVLRAVLALGWWALAMTAWSHEQSSGVKDAFNIVLKVWACVTLFMTANLLKTLLAKMLSSKFNKESHMQKIQDSLVKEYHLHMLLQPRERPMDSDLAAASMDGGGGGGGGGMGDSETFDKGKTTVLRPVHASTHPAATFGNTIASSVRGVTHTLFGGGSREDVNELGTVAEELLTPSEVCSPSEAAAVGDVEAPPPPRVELSVPSGGSLHTSNGTTPGGGGFRGGSAGSGIGIGARGPSSTQRSRGSAQPGTPQGRTPSTFSRTTHRISRLAPVVEQAAEGQVSAKGLSMNQMFKMEAYVRRHALQVTFRDELNATERQEEVTSETEAKKLAFFLFWNVKADPERPYLTFDDVTEFLPPGEAEQAYVMLDRNGNGSVSLSECIAAVVEIFEARCDLALSLKDTKTVITKLENVIAVVMHIIFIFIYMLVFNIDVIKTYLALSSLVLAFSFIFQNSIRTMYENVVFLFVVHPFDVGDVLQVGEGDGTQTYKVDEIDLHYTIFLAGNGARTWYPNQKLIQTPFANLTASGERGDAIKLLIDIDTPAGALDALRAACEAAVAANPTEFGDSVSVHLRDASSPLKVTLVVGFNYSHSGADAGRCNKARTIMHMALCQELATQGVRYTNPPTKELYDGLHPPQQMVENVEEQGVVTILEPVDVVLPQAAAGEDEEEKKTT